MKLTYKLTHKGPRRQDDKVVTIFADSRPVGEITFAYGRSDSLEPWTVWDVVVKIPALDIAYRPKHPPRLNYRDSLKLCREHVPAAIAERDVPPNAERVTMSAEAYGSCLDLTHRVLHGYENPYT